MESGEFVKLTRTGDGKIAVVPAHQPTEDVHILAVFDSYTELTDSDEIQLYRISEHVTENPDELMETIIEKGIEACFESPTYNDFDVMYADNHTAVTTSQL